MICLLSLLGVGTGVAHESLAQTYPGPWHREFSIPIVRTLNDNHVRNCGDLAYRPNPKQSAEYLVYCSVDDGVWRSYLVWTATGKIMGPYAVDPTVPPPKPLLDLR
jgi:hypothetical protein